MNCDIIKRWKHKKKTDDCNCIFILKLIGWNIYLIFNIIIYFYIYLINLKILIFKIDNINNWY